MLALRSEFGSSAELRASEGLQLHGLPPVGELAELAHDVVQLRHELDGPCFALASSPSSAPLLAPPPAHATPPPGALTGGDLLTKRCSTISTWSCSSVHFLPVRSSM